jgi:hypothetical protein
MYPTSDQSVCCTHSPMLCPTCLAPLMQLHHQSHAPLQSPAPVQTKPAVSAVENATTLENGQGNKRAVDIKPDTPTKRARAL